MQLVFQAFEKDPQLNIRELIQFYNILRMTLSARINDRSTHIDTMLNLRKLTALEEKVVVREVFDLDLRGFLPQMYNIEDIVNRLLAIYDTIYVGLY